MLVRPVTLFAGLLFALLWTATSAQAAIPDRVVLADFESGVDPRGALSGAAAHSGPHYAWEQPPSPAGDDINYFDVTSDGDGRDEYVDYRLSFAAQDWQPFDRLIIDMWMWFDGGGTRKSVRVYAHDAGGVGNSDGNGYHNLGTATGTKSFSLTGMGERGRVDHILIRVHESSFGAVHRNGARQRTHLKSISLRRSTEFAGTSELHETSCLTGASIEVCLDDLLGGTVSGIYNLRTAPNRNFVLPTMGGAFQFALRSDDPITACPQREIGWGAVWNPTQAGCEKCYTDGARWFHVASQVWGRAFDGEQHHIELRPRNYFHHDAGDCAGPLPYTDTGVAEEQIVATQDATLVDDDYVRLDWTFTNDGAHTHRAIPQNILRHELPTFYVAPSGHCPRVVYEDIDGHIRDITPPCHTGGVDATRVFADHRPGRENKGFHQGWFTVYDPAAPAQAITIFSRSSFADSQLSPAAVRNYDGVTGVQIDLSQYFAIAPGQTFETAVYILPYRYDEVMADGTPVLDFIHAEQAADVHGALSGGQTCASVRGWARDPGDTAEVSVRVLVDGVMVGDVLADDPWDNAVGDHGFTLNHAFGPGTHTIDVLARDHETGNYRQIAPTRTKTCN